MRPRLARALLAAETKKPSKRRKTLLGVLVLQCRPRLVPMTELDNTLIHGGQSRHRNAHVLFPEMED